MKKLLIITGIDDLSVPLYLTQDVQKIAHVDFYFFHEELVDLEKKLKNNTFDEIYFGYHFRFLNKKQVTPLFEMLLKHKRDAYIIDHLKSVDDLYFEDKWTQYQSFENFMPKTNLLSKISDANNKQLITKERISGRAEGVFFNSENINEEYLDNYISQNRLTIKKEYRVYVVCNKVMPYVTIRTSKTPQTKIKVIGSEKIEENTLSFSQIIANRVQFDLMGLDIALDYDNKLWLIEVNRTCLFNSYFMHTNINIAERLIRSLDNV